LARLIGHRLEHRLDIFQEPLKDRPSLATRGGNHD
jgi:hypothetical protein